MFEATVIIKGEKGSDAKSSLQTLRRKFVCYQEGVMLSKNDPHLNQLVHDAIGDFKGDIDEVRIKFDMQW